MRILTILLSLMIYISVNAQEELTLKYYFPETTFDTAIPTPQEVIGFVPGEWHVSHDRLVQYMNALAEASPRITLRNFAKSHEGRQLLALVITSEKNQQNIDQLKKAHLDFVANSNQKLTDEVPTVLYQGYSVHGNESSGANAAILYAYYLAAAQGKEIDQYLDQQIILLDPCFNPDGLHRFSSWVNMHKSIHQPADPADREFQEPWPGGRTNHYWFDLNRDWLLLVHPESRGRIGMFHEWRPNIVTDHHEMGSDNTFFFQPGIPTRTNPLTPKKNQDLTYEIGKFHAAELDAIGSQYYSQESFDDFYYGKGSTYPDVNGCIGILFEQASSRGHYRQTKNGILTFPFTVRNQLSTSISTLKAGAGLRKDLLNFQQQFFANSKKMAGAASMKGYVVGDMVDQEKLMNFARILKQHKIEVFQPTAKVQIKGRSYAKENALVIPSDQHQYRLIRAIFETQTNFTDSLFYDVSAWNLAMAHDLEYEEIGAKNMALLKNKTLLEETVANGRTFKTSDYGYLIDWRDYATPKAIYSLQAKGLRLRLPNKSFTAKVEGSQQEFQAGTIFLPLQNQNLSPQEIVNLLKEFKAEGIDVYGVDSGFTPVGIDLGSPSMSTLPQPKVLMLIGDGISGYDAGELWHQFDTRYEMPITKVQGSRFGRVDLSKYNVLIIPDGNPRGVGNGQIEKIKSWVKAGGTIIGFQNSSTWLTTKGLAFLKEKEGAENGKSNPRPYDKYRADNGAEFIGGAIFNNVLDLSHPLCFGYTNDQLPVFHQGTKFYKYPKNNYAAPVKYDKNPLLAGYISKDNLKEIASSSAVLCNSLGRGKVITFSFNPTFRGYWRGTERLLTNAIFFGSTINVSTCEKN